MRALGILSLSLGLILALPTSAAAQSAQERAAEAFAELERAYLAGDWGAFDRTQKEVGRYAPVLSRQQRRLLKYTRDSAEDFQPDWWGGVKTKKASRFPAEIWDKRFIANYQPSRNLGLQAVQMHGMEFQTGSGKTRRKVTGIDVIVTWRPEMVDNPDPATGPLAEIHGIRQRDIAEVIVWHELGHNYVTRALPQAHVVDLVLDHGPLYSHLQEFYADLTALHHASPPARRAALMLRLEGLDHYLPHQSHRRASHGIGALLLVEVMSDPDAWPSVRFPPAVPKQQVELNTIIYVYEHWRPEWSLVEAKALREISGNFINKQGDRTLRRRGEFSLSNGTKFSLMVEGDRKHQPERDRWVAKQLERLIKSGRADTLEEGEVYDPPLRTADPKARQETDDDEKMLLRIDIPEDTH